MQVARPLPGTGYHFEEEATLGGHELLRRVEQSFRIPAREPQCVPQDGDVRELAPGQRGDPPIAADSVDRRIRGAINAEQHLLRKVEGDSPAALGADVGQEPAGSGADVGGP